MWFDPKLGTVNYVIDTSGAGQVTDQNGVSARYAGKINLYTNAFVNACTPGGASTASSASSTATGAASSTTISKTTTTTVTSSASSSALGAPALTPAPNPGNHYEGAIGYYTTSASSLNLKNGPATWVTAGQYLTRYVAPQSVPCGQSTYQNQKPLLSQMARTIAPS